MRRIILLHTFPILLFFLNYSYYYFICYASFSSFSLYVSYFTKRTRRDDGMGFNLKGLFTLGRGQLYFCDTYIYICVNVEAVRIYGKISSAREKKGLCRRVAHSDILKLQTNGIRQGLCTRMRQQTQFPIFHRLPLFYTHSISSGIYLPLKGIFFLFSF